MRNSRPESIDAVVASIGEDQWMHLTSQPGTGVAVSDARGLIEYTNDHAARIWLGDALTRDDAIGETMANLIGDQVTDEVLASFDRVASTGHPTLMRHIWTGHQVKTTHRQIRGTESFLIVTRHAPGPDEPDDHRYHVIQSQFIELGPLSVLTARELQVLALTGQGLSQVEIAEVLCCSRKTVDNHRQSISRKIHVGDRVRLAQIVFESGLRVGDALRQRVQSEQARAIAAAI